MALTLLAANNAQTVLAAGISSSATSMTVNTGTGSLFPSPSAGTSFFKLTLVDSATGQLTEIVHVTARSGDTMTIERGQEGTTSRAWSANDIVANMMTAGTLSYVLTNFQPLDATLTALATLATGANKLPYFTGVDAAALTDFTDVGRSILGQTTIANLLAYLGLGDGSTLPVGTPVPWPTSTAPTGWLKCNGATFTAAQYPKLALAYPGLVLPDLRGKFIRGWDDARGVDSGRIILSSQTDAMQNVTGTLNSRTLSSGAGAITGGTGVFTFQTKAASGSGEGMTPNGTQALLDVTTFNLSNVARTATETRPVNIAFNYIVRAA